MEQKDLADGFSFEVVQDLENSPQYFQQLITSQNGPAASLHCGACGCGGCACGGCGCGGCACGGCACGGCGCGGCR